MLTLHLPGTWSGAFRAGTQIHKDSGVLGLFQGHSATLLRIFPYAAIKFMAYDQVHDVRIPSSLSDPLARSLAHRLDFAGVDAYPCTRNQPAAVLGGCYIGCVGIFAMCYLGGC